MEVQPVRFEGHYHVDVFRSDGRFVRGLTAQQVAPDQPLYRVIDDFGLAAAPGTAMSGPLELAEALRQALVLLRRRLTGSITPAFGAPFELLGYRRPGFFRPGQAVGEDGRPAGPFLRERRSGGTLLVELEEDGVGIYGSPTWLRDLRFAFDLLFRLLEAAPGGRPVESVRFENPASGAVFVEADLVPRGADLPRACAEAALGNKVDEGRIVVDGVARRLRCDCRARVDVWMELSPGPWLTARRLQEIGEAVAQRNGVRVAW